MSRELEIIDALAELSLERREIDLESIQNTVQRHQDRGDLLPDTWKQVARQVLRTLASMGMVQVDGDENTRLSYGTVKLTDQFLNTEVVKAVHTKSQKSQDSQSDHKVNDEDNGELPSGEVANTEGGGSRRGSGGSRFDQGDGGGEGFREVLAHPYLFSLSKSDFEDILNQI